MSLVVREDFIVMTEVIVIENSWPVPSTKMFSDLLTSGLRDFGLKLSKFFFILDLVVLKRFKVSESPASYSLFSFLLLQESFFFKFDLPLNQMLLE